MTSICPFCGMEPIVSALHLYLAERGLLGLVLDVCKSYHATFEEISGRSRELRVSRARQAAWSLLEARGLSRSEIGRAFGRDHTTVVAGIAAADKRASASKGVA